MNRGVVIDGRFELVTAAGRGASGSVFRALDLESGEEVAVKLLHATLAKHRERFDREARALAELDHPGIVRLVAHGVTGVGPYLVMEWLLGETLANRLRAGRLEAAEAVQLAVQVAQALDHAHRAGVVHRDVKPSNLFLPEGRLDAVKLIDFGLARLKEPSDLTSANILLGTPRFMAPEQVRSARSVDGRADLFSLGCVLYAALAGSPPFLGDEAMAVAMRILFDEVPPIATRCPQAEVPEALEQAIRRLLAKDPGARFQTGAHFVAALEALDPGASVVPGDAPLHGIQGLTGHEQHVVSLVAARIAGDPSPEGESLDRTAERAWIALEQAAIDSGGRLERLVTGALVALFAGDAAPHLQAARAARCALYWRALLPQAAIAVATGRGVLTSRYLLGESIDRLVSMLTTTAFGAVSTDAATCQLLDAGFEITRAGGAFLLASERQVTGQRTLCGQVTRCVGRSRELGVMSAVYRSCREESRAAAVLVTAPAGVGKSRLKSEFLLEVLRQGRALRILNARALHADLESPYGLAVQLLRMAAGLRGGVDPALERACLSSHLTPILRDPRDAEFLLELCGLRSGEDSSVELLAAQQDPQLMADRVREAWQGWLHAECRDGGRVLCLEDLQWADRASIELLDRLLLSLDGAPLLVLATARPEVRERFPGLWEGRDLTELRLGALPAASARELAREVLGPGVSDTQIDGLVARSEGNAFYLEELIRAASRGDSELPLTVIGMAQARLKSLHSDARRVLRAASVFGSHFWPSGVAALCGGGDARDLVTRQLARLCEAELVEPEDPAGAPEEMPYRFCHELIREAAYGLLTDEDRALGHRLAGEWLERSRSVSAASLAHHFACGDEPSKAVRWHLEAAQQAFDSYDYQGVLRATGQALALGAPPASLGRLHAMRAEAHAWRAEHSEAAAAASLAQVCFEPGSAPWFRTVALRADALLGQSDQDGLTQAVSELYGTAHVGAEAGEARAIALCRAAKGQFFAGQHRLGTEMIERAAACAAASPTISPPCEGSLGEARAIKALYTGNLGVAAEHYRQCIEAFERVRDVRHACQARINLGFTLVELGCYAEASEVLELALAGARQLANRRLELTVCHNLGLAKARMGEVRQALHVEQQAIDGLRELPEPRLLGASLAYQAQILAQAGDPVSAEKSAREAIEVLGAYPSARAEAYASLAACLLVLARPREALDAARRAHALKEELGGLEGGAALVDLMLAESLRACGEPDAALAAIQRAREDVVRRAGRIVNETLRAGFLKKVPENAWILKNARTWVAPPPRC